MLRNYKQSVRELAQDLCYVRMLVGNVKIHHTPIKAASTNIQQAFVYYSWITMPVLSIWCSLFSAPLHFTDNQMEADLH